MVQNTLQEYPILTRHDFWMPFFIDHYERLGWILPLRSFEPIRFTKNIFKNPRGQKSGKKY